MQVTKKVSLNGEWAKVGVDINDGDVFTILNEGETVTGEYGDRQVFKIAVGGGEKLLSFNQTSINNLIDGFGKDTVAWINQEVKVWIIKQMISNKLRNVVYLAPKDWIMTDDGSFQAPVKTEKDDDPIPVHDPIVEEGEVMDENQDDHQNSEK